MYKITKLAQKQVGFVYQVYLSGCTKIIIAWK